MRKSVSKAVSIVSLCAVAATSVIGSSMFFNPSTAQAAQDSTAYKWDAVRIGGGGFVSGIITGQKAMYARTDVGGAYRYDYDNDRWVQLMSFINEEDRGYLSIDALCIDPTDDDTIYVLCGCAYFSAERTAIFKSTDGGRTFTEHDVTDLIKVHGNGYGRQCGEAIAVDPDNPKVIYCGGDTDGLIMSKDGGETWGYVDSFNDLGLFTNEVKWPTWTDTIEKTTVGTDYGNCNGIATVAIQKGKVYVGVSDNTIGANIYVADVGKDNWKPLSKDLPTDAFPSRINKDADGNLLITYVGGLAFAGTGGGIYRYDITKDTVTNISPTENSYGSCVSLPTDANTLVATTCGVWSSQLWYEGAWDDDNVCWGDQFYRSTDGGATWESITPGNEKSWGGPLTADYLQDGGYDWIRNKAIHWCGNMVIDPRNPDKILIVSGNGVFACDNVWDELPVFYFHPDGIEEVVALDMISVPGGDEFSAIGDYDGFRHTDVNVVGEQHSPNMGSTSAIAYCPQNPKVMVRIAEGDPNNSASGYYTLDGGETWNPMEVSSGGKAAVTELSEGKYRILKSGKESGAVSYSDDFGKTWKNADGISGYKPSYFLVDPKDPSLVYASAIIYNQYWSSNPNVTEPTFEECHHAAFISHDYGATWSEVPLGKYDCWSDAPGDPAYISDGKVAYACGTSGLYITEDSGKTFTATDVVYAKTVGYGAPEKSGGPNTLFIYGKPKDSDPEGIYRSTDAGKTWVCINTDKLYGGTGNGNFLVGDMNEFGTVYMSTVGCGIIYGKISDGSEPVTPPATTTEATTTSKPADTTTTASETSKPADSTTEADTSKPADTTTSKKEESSVTSSDDEDESTSINNTKPTLLGDVNVDGAIDVRDVSLLSQYLVKLKPLSDQGAANADVTKDNKVKINDLTQIKRYLIMDIDKF